MIERDSGLLRIPYVIERGRRIVVEGLRAPYEAALLRTCGKPASPCSSTPAWAERMAEFGEVTRRGETPKSVIWVPLRVQGQSLGTITVQNLDTENALHRSRRTPPRNAGRQHGGGAGECAAVQRDSGSTRAADGDGRRAAGDQPVSLRHPRPVFDKILDSCQRLFSSDELGIFLVTDDGEHVCTGQWRGSAMGRAPPRRADAPGRFLHGPGDPRTAHAAGGRCTVPSPLHTRARARR